MARSQNGFLANSRAVIKRWKIPGTSREVSLHRGATGWLLCDFAAWFDKHVESVDGGTYDDWGYAERTIRGSSTTLSNHASGTALDLNATRHPLGVRGTFSAADERKIHRQLRIYDGCIRWGGDYSGRPDEMHIEIDRDAAACRAVRSKLKKAGKTGMGILKRLSAITNKGSGKKHDAAWFLYNMEADQDTNQKLLHEILNRVERIEKKVK